MHMSAKRSVPAAQNAVKELTFNATWKCYRHQVAGRPMLVDRALAFLS
jgi:hypothetical protein